MTQHDATSKPPPPRIPPYGTLTVEEEEELPPLNLRDITHDTMENCLGVRPNDMSVYIRALTHPSANSIHNYEKLELLGDSILSFVCIKFLMNKFPDQDEGFLTVMRTKLTRSDALANFSKQLGLQQFVIMAGRSIYRSHHQGKKVLEDVFESIVAALYLDHNMATVSTFIHRVFDRFVVWERLLVSDNWKELLMHRQHRVKQSLPDYVSVRNDETKEYTCTIHLDGCMGRGGHKIKKQAEQLAAKDILQKLRALDATRFAMSPCSSPDGSSSD